MSTFFRTHALALVGALLLFSPACVEPEEHARATQPIEAPLLDLPDFQQLDGYWVADANYCDNEAKQVAKVMLSDSMYRCLSDGDCGGRPSYSASLLIHGMPGDPQRADYVEWQKSFADRDIISVSIDYDPHLLGRWSLLKVTAEARCAVRWVRTLAEGAGANPRGINSDSIAVVGHSMGSLLAQSLLFTPHDHEATVCVDDDDGVQRHQVSPYEAEILAGMGLAQGDPSADCYRMDERSWNRRERAVGGIEDRWSDASSQVHGGVLTSTLSGILEVSSECSILPSLFGDEAGTRFPLVVYHRADSDEGVDRRSEGEIYCGRYRDLQQATRSFNAFSDVELPQALNFRILSQVTLGAPLESFAASYRGTLDEPDRYEEIVPQRAYFDRDKRARLERLSPLSWIPRLAPHQRLPVLIMQGRRDHELTPWPGAVSLGMALRQYGHVAEAVLVPTVGHSWKEDDIDFPLRPTRSDLSTDFVKTITCATGRGVGCDAELTPSAWLTRIGVDDDGYYDDVDLLDRYTSAGEARILLRPNASAVTRPHQDNMFLLSPDRLVNRYGADHNLYTGLHYRYDSHYFVEDGRGWADRTGELVWRVSGAGGELVRSLYELDNGLDSLDRARWTCSSIEVHPVLPGQDIDAQYGGELEPWCLFPLPSTGEVDFYQLSIEAPGTSASSSVAVYVKPHPYDGDRFPVTVDKTQVLWSSRDLVDWPGFTSILRPGGLVDVVGSGNVAPLETIGGKAPLGLRTRAEFHRGAADEYQACFTGTRICSDWKAPQ